LLPRPAIDKNYLKYQKLKERKSPEKAKSTELSFNVEIPDDVYRHFDLTKQTMKKRINTVIFSDLGAIDRLYKESSARILGTAFTGDVPSYEVK
jgi:hypothetical protein